MTQHERLQVILSQHDVAMGAFRQASDAFDAAVAGLRTVLDAVSTANHAQGEAIAAMMAANRIALQMLNAPENNAPHRDTQ